MKTIAIVFAVIGLAAWMAQTAYAEPSPATRHPSSGNPQAGVPPPGAKRDHRRNETINHRAAQVRSGATAIGGPARPGKNAAAITGKSADANRRMSAVNGTAMNRKPR